MILRGSYIQIGGAKQWISYNAEHLSKPLILFLHGGPGFVMTPLLQHYCTPIYEHYLVVHWDQRGSGKSYYFWGNDALSVSQLVADGIELAELLCKKFQKEKILYKFEIDDSLEYILTFYYFNILNQISYFL